MRFGNKSEGLKLVKGILNTVYPDNVRILFL